MSTPRVRLCPSDRPDGRIVVRLINVDTGELVRAGEADPLHYETVQAALAACEREGITVLSAVQS